MCFSVSRELQLVDEKKDVVKKTQKKKEGWSGCVVFCALALELVLSRLCVDNWR